MLIIHLLLKLQTNIQKSISPSLAVSCSGPARQAGLWGHKWMDETILVGGQVYILRELWDKLQVKLSPNIFLKWEVTWCYNQEWRNEREQLLNPLPSNWFSTQNWTLFFSAGSQIYSSVQRKEVGWWWLDFLGEVTSHKENTKYVFPIHHTQLPSSNSSTKSPGIPQIWAGNPSNVRSQWAKDLEMIRVLPLAFYWYNQAWNL